MEQFQAVISKLSKGILDFALKIPLSENIFSLFCRWILEKLHLIEIHKKQHKPRRVLKGQIYWCNFGFNVGSEFSSVSQNASSRPCLILRNNAFMNSGNAIVAPMTKYSGDKKIVLTDIIIHPDQKNNLHTVSIIKIANLRDVSLVRLGNYIGHLDVRYMYDMDEKLQDLFGIKKEPRNIVPGDSPQG